MNILLTNDDGIEAPGIWVAARALATLGHLLVVAPASNQSGYGAAVKAIRELSFARYSNVPEGLAGVTAFAVPAPPAVCVQVGLSGVLSEQPIDLVVSGINDGLNVGRDLLYSGTVGAALTAHLLGTPALAASLDCNGDTMHWETAGWALQELVKSLDHGSEPASVLNLNAPNIPVESVAGFMATSLGNDCCLDRTSILAGSEGMLRFSYTPAEACAEAEPGTDVWAVARGYVSVTPVSLFPDMLNVVLAAK